MIYISYVPSKESWRKVAIIEDCVDVTNQNSKNILKRANKD